MRSAIERAKARLAWPPGRRCRQTPPARVQRPCPRVLSPRRSGLHRAATSMSSAPPARPRRATPARTPPGAPRGLPPRLSTCFTHRPISIVAPRPHCAGIAALIAAPHLHTGPCPPAAAGSPTWTWMRSMPGGTAALPRAFKGMPAVIGGRWHQPVLQLDGTRRFFRTWPPTPAEGSHHRHPPGARPGREQRHGLMKAALRAAPPGAAAGGFRSSTELYWAPASRRRWPRWRR